MKADLFKILEIYPGDRITIADVDRLKQRIETWFESDGFPDSNADVRFETNENKIQVTINVAKGIRQKLVGMEFQGMSHFDKNLNVFSICYQKNMIFDQTHIKLFGVYGIWYGLDWEAYKLFWVA